MTVHQFVELCHVKGWLNPTALRKAKIVCNFGLSECNRVNVSANSNDSQYYMILISPARAFTLWLYMPHILHLEYANIESSDEQACLSHCSLHTVFIPLYDRVFPF